MFFRNNKNNKKNLPKYEVQCNTVNPVTKRPQKSDCNYEVSISVKGFQWLIEPE